MLRKVTCGCGQTVECTHPMQTIEAQLTNHIRQAHKMQGRAAKQAMRDIIRNNERKI
jgi:predicted small metal-binding protein